MIYLELKHSLANSLKKAAKTHGLPLRSLLACVATSENSVGYRNEIASKFGIKVDLSIPNGEINPGNLAAELLIEKKLPRLYNDLIPTERLAVDFSSPNIAKPFHVGHLTSTILGNYVCNLKSYLGDKVKRINYLGDWGTQFGILSAAFAMYGSQEKLKKNALGHLLEVYVEGNKLAKEDESFAALASESFAKLESGDETVKEIWWNFRDISLKEYFKIYSKLGIKFDLIQGESAFHKDALQLIEEAKKDSLLTELNGLQGLFVKDDNFVPLLKSNGSTLYITRDICAAIARRKEFKLDSTYYVVDNSQTKHFTDLKYCLEKLNKADMRIVHVKFGKMRGLSTRKGEVVLLEDLVDEACNRALQGMDSTKTTKVPQEERDKTALDLALAALYVNTMKSNRQRDSTFDWERCFSFKGDSGISLQYAHARLCSLEEVNQQIEPRLHIDIIHQLFEDYNLRAAVVHLAQFEECLLRSDTSLEPSELVQYLFKLSHIVSRMTKTCQVKGEKSPLAESRLLVFTRLREVLAEGLRLLGVKPVRKM